MHEAPQLIAVPDRRHNAIRDHAIEVSGLRKTYPKYIGATPAIAILPWFFAGALFPIAAWLSLAVVAAFAAAFILVAVRSFSRAALR